MIARCRSLSYRSPSHISHTCFGLSGSLLGGITSFVLRATLTHEQLVRWGWRIPFLAGVSVSYFAYYLKSHGSDSTGHDLQTSERSKDTNNHRRADSDSDEIVVHSSALVKNPLFDAFSRA
jgi:hypothetical protein